MDSTIQIGWKAAIRVQAVSEEDVTWSLGQHVRRTRYRFGPGRPRVFEQLLIIPKKRVSVVAKRDVREKNRSMSVQRKGGVCM